MMIPKKCCALYLSCALALVATARSKEIIRRRVDRSDGLFGAELPNPNALCGEDCHKGKDCKYKDHPGLSTCDHCHNKKCISKSPAPPSPPSPTPDNHCPPDGSSFKMLVESDDSVGGSLPNPNAWCGNDCSSSNDCQYWQKIGWSECNYCSSGKGKCVTPTWENCDWGCTDYCDCLGGKYPVCSNGGCSKLSSCGDDCYKQCDCGGECGHCDLSNGMPGKCSKDNGVVDQE